MFRLEGKVIQVKLNPSIKIINFGSNYRKGGLDFFIANYNQETSFSIPLEISQNPIEERRLQKELEGRKVLYERENNISLEESEKYCQERKIVTIKSGVLKGIKLEYVGDPTED
ncbi:MAG: hypothetical protein WC511_05270 [Candidatus Pacearchaeota archaeon]